MIRHLRPLATLLLVWIGMFAPLFSAQAEELPQPVDRCPFTGRFPVEITTATPFAYQTLQGWDLDVDDVRGSVVRAYVDDAQLAALRDAGYPVEPIVNEARRAWAASPAWPGREDYHTYETLTAELQQIAADHPDLTQLFSIGTSVQGRSLWVLKISDNAAADEAEPEFKFSATIHGDEPTGTEMCVYLIRHLLQNYGVDPEITALVDEIEIFICPLHNPDGRMNGTRYNAEGFDLNRSFPDPRTDPNDTPDGRPTEVRHMMNFAYDHEFVLGANYHGGALVMNYPWDTWDGQYTPDDDLFEEICLGYSFRNPPMWNSTAFYHGITIGWAWYVVAGGMQDWSYHWRNELHVTIEMSNTKWPASTALAGLWENNRDAMLYYLGQARIGVSGLVSDALSGRPVAATVDVVEIGKDIRADALHGFYQRMLQPDTYTLAFSAPGYVTQTIGSVVVSASAGTELNVQLVRDPAMWNTVSGTVTEAETGTPLAAQVTVRQHASGLVYEVLACDPLTGAYAVGLPDGEYDFTADAPGHAPQSQTRMIAADATVDFALAAVRATVLLVKDTDLTTRLSSDLPTLGYLVTEQTNWDTDPATWTDYDLLIWSAGSAGNPVSNATLRAALEGHVAAGRPLVIEGGELGYDALISPRYVTFAANVLHVAAYHLDNAGNLEVRPGQVDNPLVTTPNALPGVLQITYAAYGDQDAVTPRPEATLIFGTHSYPSDAGVVAYQPAGADRPRTVYYAFNYDALTSAETGRALLENTLQAVLFGVPAEVPDEAPVLALRLGRPMPTPTSGGASFQLALPESAPVRLALYDASGRLVRTLLDGPVLGGEHRLVWDGLDAAGLAAAPGIYFLKADSPAGSAGRRLVVIR